MATPSADAAKRLAHSLKGSSAQIGAIRLSASAASLEAAIDEGSELCLMALETVAIELQSLLQSLHDYREPDQ